MNTMKKYNCPSARAIEVNGREMLALSIVAGGSADPDSEVLSNQKGWDAEGWSDKGGYWTGDED